VNRSVLLRVVFSLLFGLLIAYVISEGSFNLLKRDQDRQPQTITLIIPAGTAARVAAGENPPSIPTDMTFIVGDTLQVINLDAANHQLGPLFIPSGTTATLAFNALGNFDYACSFRADKYFGLTIKKPITITDRILGVIFAGLPLGILIALYAVFAAPPNRQQPRPAA